MKKTLSLTLLFVGCFVLFTVWHLPANVAFHAFASKLSNQLQFGQITGSIWNGQVTEIRVQQMPLKNVRWEISPWALLRGNLQAQVQLGNARVKEEISGHGAVTFGLFNQTIALHDATLRTSVEQAMAHVTLPLPVQAKGRVILEIQQYQSGMPYCQALQGEIHSPEIEVQGVNSWFSIGELAGSLGCKSGDIAVNVLAENRLGLQADAVLSANLQFKVAGKIKPDASLPKEVHDAVKFLGRADADGFYPIKL
ncbi:type II secretion system protein N [Pseudoalteromonas fenneropenaei]|uniref:Type II secretion system protein N n=1 Tax=Pseudoalteromonas fenneropenaei TaxID=1737459 RepID=A0ABV7CQZ3_9GAMM